MQQLILLLIIVSLPSISFAGIKRPTPTPTPTPVPTATPTPTPTPIPTATVTPTPTPVPTPLPRINQAAVAWCAAHGGLASIRMMGGSSNHAAFVCNNGLIGKSRIPIAFNVTQVTASAICPPNPASTVSSDFCNMATQVCGANTLIGVDPFSTGFLCGDGLRVRAGTTGASYPMKPHPTLPKKWVKDYVALSLRSPAYNRWETTRCLDPADRTTCHVPGFPGAITVCTRCIYTCEPPLPVTSSSGSHQCSVVLTNP